ncbi:hypothetical protein DRN69_09340 [Candidatus Pacearchaeota archaeon]|nr:MAG: hypothetical protein DRN69_09340 [Candidatus Pacearchaeota archaeon]
MHSGEGDLLRLKKIVKEETKDKIKEKIKEYNLKEKKREKKEFNLETIKKELKIPLPKPQKRIVQKIPSVLRIPEPRLPPKFQYLKPQPTSKEIDLGKLNPLIKDPLVKLIECDGPDERLIVQGAMGRKPTNIVLNKEEIDEIINKFSETSKIPVHTGIYRVVVGRLILLSIISEIIGSKFIIKKMAFNNQLIKNIPQNRPPYKFTPRNNLR